ncbi:hypothetical protein [Halomonas sp. KO116]|uniref:hypothetical protein n=1 Tax=Halomonas sp. KO116 TaxID=1504981 RepID=UPI0004E41E28|nr:hypothetical protein [Halomonas sp. KO116]AJY50437.1 hypothetical protein KO116_01956 [Halomonas sp. KO116]
MLEILKTKLQAVDSECESIARSEIDTYYQSAKYDGNRFVVPSFPQVSAVWLKLIADKEKLSKEEIAKVLSHPNSEISFREIAELNGLISELFNDSRYLDRLSGFSEGIGRKASSYGIQFDPTVYRFDLHESAYQVGVKNSLRKARRVLTAEVSLHSLPKIPESVKKIKVWLSFMRARPWQSLIFVFALVGFALLSSVGLPDILGWLNGSPKP